MLFSMQSAMMCRGNQAPIVYRSKAASPPTSTAVTKPAGIEAGDLVIVISTENVSSGGPFATVLTTTSGSAWGTATLSAGATGVYRYWWKILNATDVANTWTHNVAHNPSVTALAYRGNGATTLTVISNTANPNASASPTLAIPGYSNTESKGTICWYIDAASTDVATPPSGFTSREAATIPFLLYHAFVDALGNYTQGATITWTTTNSGGGTSGEAAVLWDVT
jgi:hypothetical protein